MKPITRFAFLVVAAACGQADMSEYEVISSSVLRIFNAGETPPAECAEVRAVVIPQRNPSFLARHTGSAEEEFFRALDAQIQPLNANVLVPNAGSDAFVAASSGQPFQGTAYSCP